MSCCKLVYVMVKSTTTQHKITMRLKKSQGLCIRVVSIFFINRSVGFVLIVTELNRSDIRLNSVTCDL